MNEIILKNVNTEKRGIEDKEQEENEWINVARKLKCEHVI